MRLILASVLLASLLVACGGGEKTQGTPTPDETDRLVATIIAGLANQPDSETLTIDFNHVEAVDCDQLAVLVRRVNDEIKTYLASTPSLAVTPVLSWDGMDCEN